MCQVKAPLRNELVAYVGVSRWSGVYCWVFIIELPSAESRMLFELGVAVVPSCTPSISSATGACACVSSGCTDGSLVGTIAGVPDDLLWMLGAYIVFTRRDLCTMMLFRYRRLAPASGVTLTVSRMVVAPIILKGPSFFGCNFRLCPGNLMNTISSRTKLSVRLLLSTGLVLSSNKRCCSISALSRWMFSGGKFPGNNLGTLGSLWNIFSNGDTLISLLTAIAALIPNSAFCTCSVQSLPF